MSSKIKYATMRDDNVDALCYAKDYYDVVKYQKITKINWFEKILLFFVKMQKSVDQTRLFPIITEYKIMFGKNYIMKCYKGQLKNYNCRCVMPPMPEDIEL
jgi:hypothetical protein